MLPSTFRFSVALAALLLPQALAHADTSSAAPAQRAQSAVIADAANPPTSPRKQNGRFATLPLRPNQAVSVTLQYPTAMAGESIVLESLDGGRVLLPANGGVIGADGIVQFHFQAPGSPGICRVIAHQAGPADTLQFWVLDQAHPDNTSPALAGGGQ